MNAERAAALVGGSRQVIANQALALSMHAWNNSEIENERLEAARWALKHWKAFLAAKQAQLDARHSKKL